LAERNKIISFINVYYVVQRPLDISPIYPFPDIPKQFVDAPFQLQKIAHHSKDDHRRLLD
jgi:hypothetical protein